MTRAEILSLLTQAAAALTTDPQTPTQWTEEDRSMLQDIHAAVVAVKLKAAVPVSDAPPPLDPYPDEHFTGSGSFAPEPKKRNFWHRLGGGMKTTLVAVGAGGGGAVVQAVVDAVKDGNISPAGLATTAAVAAVTGAIGYRAKPPEKAE